MSSEPTASPPIGDPEYQPPDPPPPTFPDPAQPHPQEPPAPELPPVEPPPETGPPAPKAHARSTEPPMFATDTLQAAAHPKPQASPTPPSSDAARDGSHGAADSGDNAYDPMPSPAEAYANTGQADTDLGGGRPKGDESASSSN